MFSCFMLLLYILMYLSFRSSTLKFENDTSRIPKILFWVGSHEVLNAFLSRVALWNNFHVALQVWGVISLYQVILTV